LKTGKESKSDAMGRKKKEKKERNKKATDVSVRLKFVKQSADYNARRSVRDSDND